MSQSLAETAAGELLGVRPSTLGKLRWRWDLWGRPEQLPPASDWRRWIILAGRGWGKTRTGAEAVRQAVSGGVRRIALVGATVADVRDVMIEGESGLVAVFPKHQRPEYQVSKRRVLFHTGAVATLYSSEKPRQLRGPQHEICWADELAAWTHLEDTWSNLLFGLRLGARPRVIVTTTPRPIDLLKQFVADSHDPSTGVVVTYGRTYDNAVNLPESALRDLQKAYAGTRLGRQELEGEILPDIEGALFRREWFRYLPDAPPLSRVVVSVDPAITRNNDETGIVVVGRAGDKAYVLADESGTWTPDEWAQKAARLARMTWGGKQASHIVAEVNRGGDLVARTIRSFDKTIPIKEVRANKGKDTRAEPIAALYEQRRVLHCGKFETLEQQMVSWDPTHQDEMRARRKATSPDRMDALVWGISELGFHMGVAKFLPINVPNPLKAHRANQLGSDERTT